MGLAQPRVRLGNWPTAEQVKELLRSPNLDTLKDKRHRALIAAIAGCGLPRSEVAQLTVTDIQKRDDRRVIVDLYGKGGHIRTLPVPEWVKTAVDCWTTAAKVTAGRIFLCVSRTGSVWGGQYRREGNLVHRQGELEQIQFLLGHASVQTTEK